MTTTYTYNAYNTLTSITKNGYTTGFSYDTTGKVTGYTEGGEAYLFEYDEMGNPVKYKVSSLTEEENLSWTQGRKLSGGTYNGKTSEYSYDPNGIRYKKKVNGNTTEYYLDGSRILAENRIGTDGMIYYIYDGTGIAGMVYNNGYYYFEKNTLGDVIRVKNQSGTVMASYRYDARGNIIEQTGEMAAINPFRFRGYYYVEETGFYYLQTRYYDPRVFKV